MSNLNLLIISIVLPALVQSASIPATIGPNGVRYRLTYGTFGNEKQGLAEVNVGGTWYSICAQGWGDVEARVFCGVVGHPGEGAVATRGAVFRRPWALPFFMTRVRCEGGETDIMACTYTPQENINLQNCPSDFLAGAICEGSEFNGGPVRLTGAGSPYEGNVEVGIGAGFGRVCDDGWGDEDAQVVCAQLGMTGGVAVRSSFFSMSPAHESLPFVFDNVQCEGDEVSVHQCVRQDSADAGCVTGNDAGVICEEAQHPVRLWNGRNFNSNNLEGNVEMRVGFGFRKICDRGFGDEEARVVCDELGYHGPAEVIKGTPYGARPRLAWANVQCDGTEGSLFECLKGQAQDACGTDEAVGVKCSNAGSR